MPIGYPAGATIFWKGQPSKGIYVLRSGRVRLGEDSAEGRSIILRIAGSGYALGLGEVLAKKPYTLAAEALEPVQAKFFSRPEFLRLMQKDSQVAENIIAQMSEDLSSVYRWARRVSLAPNAEAKLAGLLLEWAGSEQRTTRGEIRLPLNLTHQQMADWIGVARETVTRSIREFREKGVIRTKGATLMIPDVSRLERYLQAGPPGPGQ